MKYYKGKYKPVHPEKYKGDPTNIIYRSLWERKVMRYLDGNSSILQWSSEELAIPYLSPIDGKWHRYFPDFIIRYKDKDGVIQVRILEIKPAKQSVAPTVRDRGQRITKKYVTEVMQYGINSVKWKAAEEYCKDRGWTFQVLTEHDLGIK